MSDTVIRVACASAMDPHHLAALAVVMELYGGPPAAPIRARARWRRPERAAAHPCPRSWRTASGAA